MGLLEIVKSYVVESDTPPTVVPKSNPSGVVAPPAEQPRMPPATYTVPIGGVTATVDQNVLAKLTEKALAATPQKYRDFQAMLDKFHQVAGMTSAAAYQAAQLATQISPVEVTQALAAMKDRLDQEEQHYSADVISSHTATQVTARQNQVDILKKKIEDGNKRLAEIRLEITNAENDIMGLERDMREAQLSIQSGEATFKSTVAFARTQVDRARQEAIQNLTTQGAS